jgi:excinuclease UvrABC nuclease subunit
LLQQIYHLLHWVGPLLLCRDEIARIPAAIPGVYLLHSFAPAVGGYPVFYAGRSHDLRQRLAQHLDNSRAKLSIRVARMVRQPYFSAAPVPDEHIQAQIESALIRILEPACNGQVPAAVPVLVNLPPLRVPSLGGSSA